MNGSCKYILLILAFSFITSCENEEEKYALDDIYQVSYGTSFGECLGYCFRHIDVSGMHIKFQKEGWDTKGILPDIRSSESIDSVSWSTLIESIDYEKFTSLDSVIGCPDCADGGAEWIEIFRGGGSKKVVFEYLKEPDELSVTVEILREYLDGFE